MNDTREYTIWNSPLSVLLRGRIGPGNPKQRLDPLAPVRESNLPAPATMLIINVVRKTRLWKFEKQQIAEELVSHFADGLEAGRSVEDLIARFGDPAKAARLMRRAKIRNRPLWWKLERGFGQAIVCFVLLYCAVFAWLLFTHPSPNVDYVAELNKNARSSPEDQRGWPIYRKAFTKASFAKLETPLLSLYGRLGPDVVAPGDPNWPTAKALLDQHAELLAAIREAASKPHLGLIVGEELAMSREDLAALGAAPPMIDDDPLKRNMLISVVLPHLSVLRQAGNLIGLDMRDAASNGDAERVLADYRAMRGISRQLREQPIIINALVSLGLETMADEHLRWVLRHYPATVEPVRVELLHAMAVPMPPVAEGMHGERLAVLDALQRIYTDSGDGDGHVTVDGIRILRQLGRSANAEAYSFAVLAPVAAAVLASRKEATDAVDHYISLAEQDLRRPLWEQLRDAGEADRYLTSLKSGLGGGMAYAPIILLLQGVNRWGTLHHSQQAVRASLMAGLALEVYRTRTGKYPKALAELVPQYLPQIPTDGSTGQPLLYRLIDDKPLLYGRGMDGDDDGGVWAPEKKQQWPCVPSEGDWILYPKPAEDDRTLP